MTIELDVGGLEPPEPMVRILDTLDTVPPGERLRVLTDREPVPLFRVLHNNGYRFDCAAQPSGRYELLIWQDQGEDEDDRLA